MVKVKGLLLVVFFLGTTSLSAEQTNPDKEGVAALRSAIPGSLVRLRSGAPVISFLSAPEQGSILSPTPSLNPETRLRTFIRANRDAFVRPGSPLELNTISVPGLSDISAGKDAAGLSRLRLQQVFNGIPVRFAEVSALLNDTGIRSVSSSLVSGLNLADVLPSVPADSATLVAQQHILKTKGPVPIAFSTPVLEYLDTGLLYSRLGRPVLAWFIETRADSLWRRYWIDARTGALILVTENAPNARNRTTYDANNTTTIPNSPVRIETSPPSGIADVDAAHDYAADFYDYFFLEHGRDSWDGRGGQIISVARLCDPAFGCPMANAFWNGTRVAYGAGFAIDDIVAHELTHGVIQTTADLVYSNESGALNESFSDIFGETIDLWNGRGRDGVADRWIVGEELSGRTGIRNMMTPSAYADPEKVTDISYVCGTQDNGGVHTNSGVPNHAYALMVDGGSFNGYSVSGIGLTKAGKIQYRALSQYLTATSNFLAAFDGLVQSCNDLVGADGITPNDCAQVKNALLAVEMSTPPCSTALPPPLPGSPPAPLPPAGTQQCSGGALPRPLFSDDFENSSSGQWGNQVINVVNHWNGGVGTPSIYHSGASYSGSLSLLGAGRTGVGDSVVFMTNSVAVGSGAYMQFVSQFNFETGYDGGVLEYSVDGGGSWTDAGSMVNEGKNYNGVIIPGSDNPLAGRQAYTGNSGGYVLTRLSLSSLAGQSVMFRFRVGTDLLVASPGWYIDDVQIYQCASNSPPVADPKSLIVQEDQSLAIVLSGSDADGDAITFRIVTPPQNGSLSGSPPNISYHPSPNYFGADTFTYVANDGSSDSQPASVSIQVNSVNDSPVAASQSVNLLEDNQVSVVLTGSDIDGDVLTFRVTALPAFGNVIVSGATATYVPATNYFGQDSFSFVANDGTVDSLPAIVTLAVQPVNDRPSAQDLSFTASAAIAISLSGSDPEQDSLNYRIASNPTGTLSGVPPDMIYTPPAAFSGVDSFTYVVNDGQLDSAVATVSINVNSQVGNQPPVATDVSVITNEDYTANITLLGQDPDGDTLTYQIAAGPGNGTVQGSGPLVQYVPAQNYYGSDSFTYTVSDGSLLSSVATVNIVVNAINDPPVAGAVAISGVQGEAINISLVGSDVENDPLSFGIYAQAAHGSLQMLGGQSVVYTSDSGFTGTDSFRYTVSDGNRASAPAVVSITVVAAGSGSGGAGRAGVVIVPAQGLVTTESGGEARASVSLTQPPASLVTLIVQSSDVTEGLLQQSQFEFTTQNWSQSQDIVVIGQPDQLADGDVAYQVITLPLVSADPEYNGLNPPDISLVNTEQSSSMVSIVPVQGLTTNESGTLARFSVSLNQQPDAGIIMYFRSSDSSEGRVIPESLSFTRSDWNVQKQVTVIGVDDSVNDGDVEFVIETLPLVSLDARLNGLDLPDIRVVNTDNDSGVPATRSAGSGSMGTLSLVILLLFLVRQFLFLTITGRIRQLS